MNSVNTYAGKATLKIEDSTIVCEGPVTWRPANQALRRQIQLYFKSRLEDEDDVGESKDKDLLAKIQKLSRMGTDE